MSQSIDSAPPMPGGLTRRQFVRAVAAAALATTVPAALTACGSKGAAGTITVGSARILPRARSSPRSMPWRSRTLALPSSARLTLRGSVIATALEKGEIDLYPEYTGTALLTVLKAEMETDPQAVYETVKKQYKKKWDLVWLDMAEAADSQALVITTKAAEQYGIKTISDLQAHASELRFASQGEFDERSDGLPALEAAYGAFDWKEHTSFNNGLKYEVLRNDEADVAPVYTTEGQLVDDAFTLLEDDKHVWPPYNVAPVVRGEVLDANPDIEDVLNAVGKQLTTKGLTELNAKVDIDKQDYEDVAAEFFDSL